MSVMLSEHSFNEQLCAARSGSFGADTRAPLSKLCVPCFQLPSENALASCLKHLRPQSCMFLHSVQFCAFVVENPGEVCKAQYKVLWFSGRSSEMM